MTDPHCGNCAVGFSGDWCAAERPSSPAGGALGAMNLEKAYMPPPSAVAPGSFPFQHTAVPPIREPRLRGLADAPGSIIVSEPRRRSPYCFWCVELGSARWFDWAGSVFGLLVGDTRRPPSALRPAGDPVGSAVAFADSPAGVFSVGFDGSIPLSRPPRKVRAE